MALDERGIPRMISGWPTITTTAEYVRHRTDGLRCEAQATITDSSVMGSRVCRRCAIRNLRLIGGHIGDFSDHPFNSV
jgi:hypothetical protein